MKKKKAVPTWWIFLVASQCITTSAICSGCL